MTPFTARFDGVSVTAVQDLFSIVAGSNRAVEILAFDFSQLSKVGDAQETEVLIIVRSGQTSAGSGGTAPAMNPTDTGDTAATATVRANDTTQANTGTIVQHYSWYWNVRAPFVKIFLPEERPLVRVSRRLTIELKTAITTTMAGNLVWRELG